MSLSLVGESIEFMMSDNGCGIYHPTTKKRYKRLLRLEGGEEKGLDIMRQYFSKINEPFTEKYLENGAEFYFRMPIKI